MRIRRFYFLLALFLFLGLDGKAQLKSTVVGSPHYCREEAGQIEVSYEVRNAFTNNSTNSLVVKLGLSRVLTFYLFSGQDHIDASSAVYQSNQDSVGPLPFKTKRLKPEESVEWNAVATIMIDGQGPLRRLPKPGDYFLLPFPDIQVEGHYGPVGESFDRSRLLPITIAKPEFDPPLCVRPK
ncbi:MAG: hypothetical protein WBD67_03580 [Terracidiphilus sp.]